MPPFHVPAPVPQHANVIYVGHRAQRKYNTKKIKTLLVSKPLFDLTVFTSKFLSGTDYLITTYNAN